MSDSSVQSANVPVKTFTVRETDGDETYVQAIALVDEAGHPVQSATRQQATRQIELLEQLVALMKRHTGTL